MVQRHLAMMNSFAEVAVVAQSEQTSLETRSLCQPYQTGIGTHSVMSLQDGVGSH